MNLAKVSVNGQLTIPVEVRRKLRIKTGDKVLFLDNPNGEVILINASADALKKVQQAFSGVAETLGSPTEDDIQSWVDEVRYGKEE